MVDTSAPWTGELLSGPRLVLCLAVTTVGIALDAALLGRPGVATAVSFARAVAVHTLGFYGGFTMLAALDTEGT